MVVRIVGVGTGFLLIEVIETVTIGIGRFILLFLLL